MVLQKEKHSLIVAELCRELAVDLGLDAAEKRLAEAVGLCHDVGRFRQATVYRTFNDRTSVDHGRLGVEELLTAGGAAEVAPDDWDALAFAVRWHNAAALPDQPDPRFILHGRIIRDTDKLDIYRVLPPGPPVDGCSPRLVDDFLAGRPLYYENIQTADDRKLIMISWLCDVNFPWTVREIASRGYTDRLLASLPPTPALSAIKAKLDSYVSEKLAG
ncbi:MAG TPA: HD domain-containing protein [Negativicutes bacterium]|nr:HD domain-containing protein [Negativicutes bacterium]